MVPAFNPNAGGVQRSTFKMSSYFKSVGYDTSVFSYANNQHSSQEVAELYHSKNPGLNKNPDNNIELLNVIKKINPDIIINQMPYEYQIGEVLLKARKEDINFLLLGCLRNTLFSVKLNLEFYTQKLVPSLILPVFKNKLGYFIVLSIHKYRHKKYLKQILDKYDYFVMFGPPNID
jgi:hypothetical protein